MQDSSQTTIDSLKQDLQEIITIQSTNKTNLYFMKEYLKDFTQHIAPEIIKDSDNDSDTGSDSDDDEPEGHYVAGDSLLRDFEPTKDEISINYTSGAKFSDIKKQKRKSQAENTKTYISSVWNI